MNVRSKSLLDGIIAFEKLKDNMCSSLDENSLMKFRQECDTYIKDLTEKLEDELHEEKITYLVEYT